MKKHLTTIALALCWAMHFGLSADVKASDTEVPYFVEVEDDYISVESVESICKYVGEQYNICPELLQALAWTESRYYINATSSANAKGLCQIIEKWNKDRIEKLEVTDIYDPYSNILVAADLLRYLLDEECHGTDDIALALMIYHMGPNAAWRMYNQGIISWYAVNVLELSAELEVLHGK